MVSSTVSGIRSRVLDAIHQVVSMPDRNAVKRRIAAAGSFAFTGTLKRATKDGAPILLVIAGPH